MHAWMTLWTALLAVSAGSFLLMLLLITAGAVRELRETLQDLREDTQNSALNPEMLDELA